MVLVNKIAKHSLQLFKINMLLTKHIQITHSGGIVTNAIWCKALITASLTTINSCKNKLFSASENIPSVLPYPCDAWRRITRSITMKSYITSFSYWTWTLLCWHLWLNCKNNQTLTNWTRGPYWGTLAWGYGSTDWAQQGPHKNNRGPIFSRTAWAR